MNTGSTSRIPAILRGSVFASGNLNSPRNATAIPSPIPLTAPSLLATSTTTSSSLAATPNAGAQGHLHQPIHTFLSALKKPNKKTRTNKLKKKRKAISQDLGPTSRDGSVSDVQIIQWKISLPNSISSRQPQPPAPGSRLEMCSVSYFDHMSIPQVWRKAHMELKDSDATLSISWADGETDICGCGGAGQVTLSLADCRNVHLPTTDCEVPQNRPSESNPFILLYPGKVSEIFSASSILVRDKWVTVLRNAILRASSNQQSHLVHDFDFTEVPLLPTKSSNGFNDDDTEPKRTSPVMSLPNTPFFQHPSQCGDFDQGTTTTSSISFAADSYEADHESSPRGKLQSLVLEQEPFESSPINDRSSFPPCRLKEGRHDMRPCFPMEEKYGDSIFEAANSQNGMVDQFSICHGDGEGESDAQLQTARATLRRISDFDQVLQHLDSRMNHVDDVLGHLIIQIADIQKLPAKQDWEEPNESAQSIYNTSRIMCSLVSTQESLQLQLEEIIRRLESPNRRTMNDVRNVNNEKSEYPTTYFEGTGSERTICDGAGQPNQYLDTFFAMLIKQIQEMSAFLHRLRDKPAFLVEHVPSGGVDLISSSGCSGTPVSPPPSRK